MSIDQSAVDRAGRVFSSPGLRGWELAWLNWSKLFKRGLLLKKSIIALAHEKQPALVPRQPRKTDDRCFSLPPTHSTSSSSSFSRFLPLVRRKSNGERAPAKKTKSSRQGSYRLIDAVLGGRDLFRQLSYHSVTSFFPIDKKRGTFEKHWKRNSN